MFQQATLTHFTSKPNYEDGVYSKPYTSDVAISTKVLLTMHHK